MVTYSIKKHNGHYSAQESDETNQPINSGVQLKHPHSGLWLLLFYLVVDL